MNDEFNALAFDIRSCEYSACAIYSLIHLVGSHQLHYLAVLYGIVGYLSACSSHLHEFAEFILHDCIIICMLVGSASQCTIFQLYTLMAESPRLVLV